MNFAERLRLLTVGSMAAGDFESLHAFAITVAMTTLDVAGLKTETYDHATRTLLHDLKLELFAAPAVPQGPPISSAPPHSPVANDAGPDPL